MHEMNEKYVPYRGYDAPYIFVSYAHKDGNKASEVIGKLQMEQYRVWYDEGIDPGTEWDENIAEHIENCEYFIALLSREYLVSSNCKDELNFARELEKPRLLIYLEDIQLPGGMRMRLSRLQAIHKYKYQSMELFFEKLAETQGLEKCHEKQKQEKTIIIESTEVVQETPRITIPTQYIFDKVGDSEAISLFSMTFSIKHSEGRRKSYIFTFVDMPGEIFDDKDGADALNNNRQIISEANAIWFCLSPAQIEGRALTADAAQVNTAVGQAFHNIRRTANAINGIKNIPTAVLITCSDQINEEYGLFDTEFDPFNAEEPENCVGIERNRRTPWVSKKGKVCYNNMQWFIKNAYNYIKQKGGAGMPENIYSIFGDFTPFAVASYGKDIGDELLNNIRDQIPEPSMVEAPFLWTLAALNILPVYEEQLTEREEEQRYGFLRLGRRRITVQEMKSVKLEGENLNDIYYYKGN